MKTAGIIAEYNPFHNGHAHQINMLKKMGYDTVICVCSPAVVQRGSFAMFPLHVRAKAALLCGADIVITLPAPYACKSAEGFAQAAVYLLCALGVCNVISFGAENAQTSEFMRIAHHLNSDEFSHLLKQHIKSGVSYAVAKEKAAQSLNLDVQEMLKKPNNILGIEYCRALLNFYTKKETYIDVNKSVLNLINNQGISLPKHMPQPYAISRMGANHDEPLNTKSNNENIASASSIRQAFLQSDNICDIERYVPMQCAHVYKQAVQDNMYIDENKVDIAILSRLRAMTPSEMHNIRLANEGIENKLYKAVMNCTSLNEVYSFLKSKRYAMSRIRRLVLDTALMYGNDLPNLPPYVHVVGATDNGIKALSTIKKACVLPMSHSVAKLSKANSNARQVAQADSAAQDLAALCMKKTGVCNTAYTNAFIKA